MKERPILFSGPMVLRLLDGTKTQTRRLVNMTGPVAPRGEQPTAASVMARVACPYGEVGDQLWVRETWASISPEHPRARVAYKADNKSYGIADVSSWDTGQSFPNAKLFPEVHHPDGPAGKIKRWTPSIHMPRWASRLDLVVTAKRTERLKDISDADAQAEGARHFPELPLGWRDRQLRDDPVYTPGRWSMFEPRDTDTCLSTARFAFGSAWDLINGERATWDSNPLVWVVTFQRLPAFAERDCA